MKIKHKHIETGHKKFRDLNVGETFEFQGEIFLKVVELYEFNCICFNTDTIYEIPQLAQVKPVQYEIAKV